MGIIQRLEAKAALAEPVTFEDMAELHAHIAEIELGYQRIMAEREARVLHCRVRRVAA